MSTISTFRRSAVDAKLAGVCGGVAARWGLDPVLVRVGFVLLALTGGVGVVLYLAGWLLLPVTGTERAAVDDLFGGAAARWPRELWVTLVVVACVVSFGVFGAVSPFGVAPALALLALWWFGFHRPRVRRARDAQRNGVPPYAAQPPVGLPPSGPAAWSGPVTPFTRAGAAWQARVQEVRSGGWSPTAHVAPAPPATWSPVPTGPVPPDAAVPAPAAPAPGFPAPGFPAPGSASPYRAPHPAPSVDPEEQARAAFLAEPDPVGLYAEPAPVAVPAVRRGSSLAARRLRLTTLVVLGLTWLGLGIADRTGTSVGLAVYAGSGLLVVALGLVAATRLGRARGLLPVGVLLAVVAVVVSGLVGPSVDTPTRAASGMFDHPVAYASAAAFPAAGDRLDTGDLQVDLTGVDLTADATYRAVVDTGRLVVRTPPGTGVALHYDVDTGDVRAYGAHLASGSSLQADRLLVPPAAGQHTLTLDLTVDTGVVEVRS